MKVVKYSMMIKNRDGSMFSIIDKDIAECVDIINKHIIDEYGFNMNITYTKLYDVIREKTKNSFLNQLILNITKKQLNRTELEELRKETIES